MNFKQQIAKYVTGNITTDQLPEIGSIGLDEGLDTPSLRILAGLNKDENPFQIDHYFQLSLEELNITLPDKREAAIEYALAIVDEILAGEKDVISGTSEILNNAIGSYDFHSESKQYSYDSIELQGVYGLFDTYEELSSADTPLQKHKTNKELMEELKVELLEELRKWQDKFKDDTKRKIQV